MPPDRLVITLDPRYSATTRDIAKRYDVTPTETVRRGLSLLQLWVNLGDGEELVIRNRDTGQVERVHIQWGL